MIHNRGVVEFDLPGGDKVSFKFGTLSFAIFCEKEEIELKDLLDRLQNPKPFTTINWMYSAYDAHCRIEKRELKFSPEQISEVVDSVGPTVMAQLMAQSLIGYIDKESPTVKASKKKKVIKK